ncbi:MAG: hypothetical protein ACXWWA_12610 [Chitinophagaceae bacterium]
MKSKKTTDLPDSEKDKRHLKNEEFEIDMPDAQDIPGQENIHGLPPGEFADTTISSADEEGAGILDDTDRQDEVSGQLNANVTKDEIKILDDAAGKINSTDQQNLDSAQLDQYDEDGELLNEKTGLSGKDLDVPGSELDDDNEDIGEEDEENNPYSLDEENEDKDINTRQ